MSSVKEISVKELIDVLLDPAEREFGLHIRTEDDQELLVTVSERDTRRLIDKSLTGMRALLQSPRRSTGPEHAAVAENCEVWRAFPDGIALAFETVADGRRSFALDLDMGRDMAKKVLDVANEIEQTGSTSGPKH